MKFMQNNIDIQGEREADVKTHRPLYIISYVLVIVSIFCGAVVWAFTGSWTSWTIDTPALPRFGIFASAPCVPAWDEGNANDWEERPGQVIALRKKSLIYILYILYVFDELWMFH